jgi:formylglycine-generating enzyme required for sulfatase activity
MAEPQDPKRPAPPGPPGGAPLPRLWKTYPLEESGPEGHPKKEEATGKAESGVAPVAAGKKAGKGGANKKTKDAQKSKDGQASDEKHVLIEETPTWDTYEARQKVRIIAGTSLVVLFLVFGSIVYRFLAAGRSVDESVSQEMLAVKSRAGSPNERPQQRDEEEARLLFDRAKELAKGRKASLAVAILKKVETAYPATQAAAEAREALERPGKNLPLFLDRPAVLANAGASPPAPAEAPKEEVQVVEATKAAVASGADASLVLPVNPAEPSPRATVAVEKPSRPLPKGFRPRPGADVHGSGWPLEIVGDRDGAPMVLVPGGTFVQGRDDAEPGEGPLHRVALGTYYIDRHEVTVRQFNLFQKEVGKRTERTRALEKLPAQTPLDAEDDRPVVMVTARDAADYAEWAGKRMPTEAQWEAAARTPDGRIFPWGPEPPAWSRPRSPRQIDPVMSFPLDVSPYGVFDLAGNAWEWTKDWYDARFYQQFRTASADNPTGPATKPRSLQLVVKGTAKDWTASKREGIKFDTRLPYLGFRCVLQVEGPGNSLEPPPSAAQPGQAAPVPAGAVVPF